MTEKRPARERLDRLVLQAGLASTREKAQALILAGRVRVDGVLRDKPGESFSPSAALELIGPERPFVSRGGQKLDPVLEPLGVDPAGLRCLDLGCSTGGFTDVLLRRGASHVTCVDVGRGILDASLRQDPRVQVHEGVNARYVTGSQLQPPYDLLVADLSFISLTVALPAALEFCPAGCALVLVKPQFELTPRDVGRGGVVRDPAKRAEAVRRVAEFFIKRSWTVMGVRASPLAGPKGNHELFVRADAGACADPPDWSKMLAEEIVRDVE